MKTKLIILAFVIFFASKSYASEIYDMIVCLSNTNHCQMDSTYYTNDETEYSNTTVVYATNLKFIFNVEATNTCAFLWIAEVRANTTNAEVQATVNGVAYNFSSEGNGRYQTCSGVFIRRLVTGDISFALSYRHSNGSAFAYIRRATLIVKKLN